MRPNKQESDLEFWLKAKAYWEEKLAFYQELSQPIKQGRGRPIKGDPSRQPSTEFLQDISRCRNNIYKAELNFQEAQGQIEVYTGRAKPFKAKIVAQSFKPGKIPAFNI